MTIVDPAIETAQRSARGAVEALAAQFGLDVGFVERMWTNWLTNKDMNTVYAEMVKDPAYKARFRQDSVAVIVRPACVSFTE